MRHMEAYAGRGKEDDVQTQTDDRPQATSPKRAPRRPRVRGQTAAWLREQDGMIAHIGDHALCGGAERAGPGATDEQAIDAYLEVMRRDLLAFARREG